MMRMRKWGRRINRTVLVLIAAWLAAWVTVPGWAEEAPKPPADQPAAVPAPGAPAAAEPEQKKDAGPGQKKDAAAPAVADPAAGSADQEGERAPGRVAVITISDGIFSGQAEFMMDSIERAETADVECLIIELDTPGGGLEQTWDIVKRMLGARVPVVIYVSPRGAHAASAGTFITMAAHVAAMAPSTRLGAAHPVQMSVPIPTGDETEEQRQKRKDSEAAMLDKVTNDSVALIRSVAKERGRNEDWAEKAVRESVSVSVDEAIEDNIVDLKASSFDDLLEQLDGREVKIDEKTTRVLHTRGATVERWEMTLKQALFAWLAQPTILIFLMLLGVGGIAMEFYHPGTIFPGAMGALFLILAAISSQLLPTSWGGFILILVGIGLMIAEAYVVSYGLLAVGGAILLVVGGIFLIDPSSQPQLVSPDLQPNLGVLVTLAITLGAMFVLIGYFVIRTQRGKIKTGREGMVGEIGEARSEVGPEGGKVFVHGEWWSAVSEDPIAQGAKVEVVELMEGMKLKVKPKG